MWNSDIYRVLYAGKEFWSSMCCFISGIMTYILRYGGVLRKLTLLSGPIYYFHYVVILFFDVIGIERSSGKNLFIYIVLCILIAYVGMRVEKLERKGIKYLCSISKYNSD